MRTCPKCGCYIPDKWTTCPACGGKEEKPSLAIKETQTVYYPTVRENKITVYRVEVLYDYERLKTAELFGEFESAFKYAQRKASQNDVFATQIIKDGRIIYTIQKS